MEVLIFEGPAGAGKTTAIKALQRMFPGIHLYDSKGKFTRPRNYEGIEHTALIKDVAQIGYMLSTEHSVIAFDRFWISSLIYDKLRRKETLTLTETERCLEALFSMISWMAHFYTDRKYSHVNTEFRLIWHLVVPPVEVLIEQRKETGKEYPFDPAREFWMYETFKGHLEELKML